MSHSSTTPNHPPRPPRTLRRRATLFGSLLTLAALLTTGTLLLRPGTDAQAGDGPAPSAPPPMPVEVTEVRVATAETLLAAVGSLQSNESVQLSAEIAGRIDRIAFTEGQAVSRGAELVLLDAAILKAQLDQAEASRALSEANYHRAEALLKDRAIAQREHDEAYAQWQLDEARLRLARAQLQKTRLTAPFAGTLGLRQVSVGDYVQPGQPLVNLEDISKLKVEFRLAEKFSAQVRVGQTLQLAADAFPGRSFEGKVYAINPQVEAQSRSLVVRGLLENRDGALRPGQFVQVQLGVASREGALFVPEQALIAQLKAAFVFTVVEGAAQMVPVQTGMRKKGWVEVTSGLQAGDQVITGGHQKIGPGSPVHPTPADPELFAKIQ